MQNDLSVLRGIEEAAESFARLDEAVAYSAPGLASLLMLRSAQAIVASQSGLLDADTVRAAFAALLGWWYAAESRQFVTDDRALRHSALALDATAAGIRGGRALTMSLLRESLDVEVDIGASTGDAWADDAPAGDASAGDASAGDASAGDASAGDASGSDASGGDAFAGDASASDTVEATLRRSDGESWPSLLLAATLLSGECGRVSGRSVAIARAVAPLVGGLSTDVFVVTQGTADMAAALRGLAAEARAMRKRVEGFQEDCARAAQRARGFGRGTGSALAMLDLLAGTPAITVVGAAAALELTVPTVAAAVDRLVSARLLREITGRARDRVFVYEPAIALAG